MAKSHKKKAVIGRPEGSPNKRNSVLRDERANHFRCSEGFRRVRDMLIAEGHYVSDADIYHEALQLLALKKEVKSEPNYNFWVKRIQ